MKNIYIYSLKALSCLAFSYTTLLGQPDSGGGGGGESAAEASVTGSASQPALKPVEALESNEVAVGFATFGAEALTYDRTTLKAVASFGRTGFKTVVADTTVRANIEDLEATKIVSLSSAVSEGAAGFVTIAQDTDAVTGMKDMNTETFTDFSSVVSKGVTTDSVKSLAVLDSDSISLVSDVADKGVSVDNIDSLATDTTAISDLSTIVAAGVSIDELALDDVTTLVADDTARTDIKSLATAGLAATDLTSLVADTDARTDIAALSTAGLAVTDLTALVADADARTDIAALSTAGLAVTVLTELVADDTKRTDIAALSTAGLEIAALTTLVSDETALSTITALVATSDDIDISAVSDVVGLIDEDTSIDQLTSVIDLVESGASSEDLTEVVELVESGATADEIEESVTEVVISDPVDDTDDTVSDDTTDDTVADDATDDTVADDATDDTVADDTTDDATDDTAVDDDVVVTDPIYAYPAELLDIDNPDVIAAAELVFDNSLVQDDSFNTALVNAAQLADTLLTDKVIKSSTDLTNPVSKAGISSSYTYELARILVAYGAIGSNGSALAGAVLGSGYVEGEGGILTIMGSTADYMQFLSDLTGSRTFSDEDSTSSVFDVSTDNITLIPGSTITIGDSSEVSSVDVSNYLPEAHSNEDRKILVIGAAKDIGFAGDTSFTNSNDVEDHALVIGSADDLIIDGKSLSYTGSNLALGAGGTDSDSMYLVNTTITAGGNLAAGTLGTLNISNANFMVGNGGSNSDPDNVYLYASDLIQVNGLNFSGSRLDDVYMEAITINLNNVAFPTTADVMLRSRDGTLHFDTYANKVVGGVNLTNVSHGGTTLARDHFDNGPAGHIDSTIVLPNGTPAVKIRGQ